MPDPIDPIDPLTPTPCDAAADLADQIAQALAEPKRIRGDSGEVENHSIGDLIKADQYFRGRCAVKSPRRGLSIVQLKPPGAV